MKYLPLFHHFKAIYQFPKHINCLVKIVANAPLNEWKQTFCELHKQKHEDCFCMIPYKLHTMPSKESIRLQWANALNRKSLPKQDGKPTERKKPNS